MCVYSGILPKSYLKQLPTRQDGNKNRRCIIAQATRDSKLETRTARAKLPARHEPYWRLIGQGLYLGYRIGPQGSKWLVRYYTGHKYIKRVLAEADDHRDANDIDVLTYFQAQDKAGRFADDDIKKEVGAPDKVYTVAEAVEDYLRWYKNNRKAYKEVVYRFNAHILPYFSKYLVSELKTRQIRNWHEALVLLPKKLRSTDNKKNEEIIAEDDTDAIRQRRASANKVLTLLKATLNYAWREGHIKKDDEWRRVKPFHNVDAPKIRYLTEEETTRLINVCKPAFRDLVRGALYTGGRYGELIKLRCGDVDLDAGTVFFSETKNGKSRYVYLNDEGQHFFESLVVGRDKGDYAFKRNDGMHWKKSHQSRPILEASKQARIYPPISFHVLRHSYASFLARKGVPLQVIAEALGHSDTRVTSRHYAHLCKTYVADTIRASLPSFGIEKSNVRVMKLKAQANE